MLKKLFLFFLIALLTVSIYAAQTLTITTSQGDKEFTKPEGMSDDDIIIMLSQMYWEERFEHEALMQSANDLTEKANAYIDTVNDLQQKNTTLNQSYTDMINSYDTLVSAYKKLLNGQHFKVHIGLGYNRTFTATDAGSPAFLLGFSAYSFMMYSQLTTRDFTVGVGVTF